MIPALLLSIAAASLCVGGWRYRHERRIHAGFFRQLGIKEF